MHSGSQFVRITTRIKSGPNVFGELRLVMTYLTNLGVSGTLCSF